MSVVAVNWKKLVRRLLPVHLVNDLHVAWLHVLTVPVAYLAALLVNYRLEVIDSLRYNSQRLLFERFLRVRLNDNTIEVINNKLTGFTVVYPAAFGLSVPVVYPAGFSISSPVVFPADTVIQTTHFTVRVPTALSGQEAEIRALVNSYKHAAFTYNIEYV